VFFKRWDFKAVDEAEIDMDKSTDFELVPLVEVAVGPPGLPRVACRTILRGGWEGGEGLDTPHCMVVDLNGKMWRLDLSESFSLLKSGLYELYVGLCPVAVPCYCTLLRCGCCAPAAVPCRSAPLAPHVLPCASPCAPHAPRVVFSWVSYVDVPDEGAFRVLDFHAGGVTAMDVSPVDHFAVTGGEDGSVRLVDYVARKEVRTWTHTV
jgi:hypothetical protein